MPEVGESSRSREEEPREILMNSATDGYTVVPGLEMPPFDREASPEADQREFQDIQVVTEQLRVVDPVEGQADSELEGDRVEMADPVRGGVMRMSGDSEEDYDTDNYGTDDGYGDDVGGDSEGGHIADSDPDEGEQEPAPIEEADPASPEYHTDFQGMMHLYADRILELLEEKAQQASRIADLEEQNQTHQTMEDQHQDVAYQRVEEVKELRQQLELSEVRAEGLQRDREELQTQLTEMTAEFDLEIADKIRISDQWIETSRHMRELAEERILDGQHLIQMGDQLVQAEVRADRYRAERDAVRVQLQAVTVELGLACHARDLFHEFWVTAATRVDELEEQVQVTTARVDAAGFALDTAFGRLRSRIRRFRREEDMSRQVVSRRIVDRIARQEHEDAARRMDQ